MDGGTNPDLYRSKAPTKGVVVLTPPSKELKERVVFSSPGVA